jgi:hypothetical protein
MSAETTAIGLSRLEAQMVSNAPASVQAANLALRTSNAITSLGITEAMSLTRSLFGKRPAKCPPCPTPDFSALERRLRAMTQDVCYKIPGVPTSLSKGATWTRNLQTFRLI